MTMVRYTDLYPASITPAPPGVPESSAVKLRVVITDQYLTVGWAAGSEVQRVDIPLVEGDIGEDVTFSGGTVLHYTVSRRGACSTCGSGRMMLRWDPWPGTKYVEEPRKQQEMVQRAAAAKTMTGLVPGRMTRYSR